VKIMGRISGIHFLGFSFLSWWSVSISARSKSLHMHILRRRVLAIAFVRKSIDTMPILFFDGPYFMNARAILHNERGG